MAPEMITCNREELMCKRNMTLGGQKQGKDSLSKIFPEASSPSTCHVLCN